VAPQSPESARNPASKRNHELTIARMQTWGQRTDTSFTIARCSGLPVWEGGSRVGSGSACPQGRVQLRCHEKYAGEYWAWHGSRVTGDPGHAGGEWCEIAGIASRDRGGERRRASWDTEGYGATKKMLGDPEIGPLHSAAQPPARAVVPAGPRREARAVRETDRPEREGRGAGGGERPDRVKMGEAFMVQNHPQWRRIVELVRGGRIGELRSAVGTFSYFKLERRTSATCGSTAEGRYRYSALCHQDVAHGVREEPVRVSRPSRGMRD